MIYRPTMRSLVASAATDLTLAILATIVLFLPGPKALRIGLFAVGAVGSLLSFSVTLMAHLVSVHVNDEGISTKSPLAVKRMRWTDVRSAVLRERSNRHSRTDRLLLLHTARGTGVLSFNLSTLSRVDEEAVLACVRANVRVVVVESRPTI